MQWQTKLVWLSSAPPEDQKPPPMSRGEKIMLASVVIGGLGFAMNAAKFLTNPRGF